MKTKKSRKRIKKTKPTKKAKKKKFSIRDHTIDILKRSKKPLHHKEITMRIKKRGYRFHRKDPERSVYIIINRYPRLFEKTKPATYKLR